MSVWCKSYIVWLRIYQIKFYLINAILYMEKAVDVIPQNCAMMNTGPLNK